MKLSPGESVLLLSPDRDDGIAGSAGDILRLDHGVDTFPMLFMQGSFGPGEKGHDIRTAEGASRAVRENSGPDAPSLGWSSPCVKAGRKG